MTTFGAAAYAGRVGRALDFKGSKTLWCGIGRQIGWVDDLYPPEPDLTALTIEEPLVYVKADFTTLCVWSEVEADVEVADNYFAYIADVDALDNFARFLYAQFTFDGTIVGMPFGQFRQVGVFSDLVPASGHESDIWLPPANVSSVGTLEYISNRRPVTFSDGEVRMERIIIEFK